MKAMCRKTILCVCLCVCLSFILLITGCSASKAESSVYASDTSYTDYNQYLHSHGFIAITSESYVFLQDKQLLFLPANTKSSELMPLCAEANCDHKNSNCSSWVDTSSIYCWNDRLYYISLDSDMKYALYSMNIYGKDRRLEKAVSLLNHSNCGFSYQIYDGYLAIDYFDTTSEDTSPRYTIFLCKLDDNSQPECIFQDDDISYLSMELRDGWVFAYAQNIETKDISLWGMDVTTGEKSQFASSIDLTVSPILRGNDTLMWFAQGDGAYKVDLSDKQSIQQFYSIQQEDSTAWGFLDDKYLYLVDYETTHIMKIIDDHGAVIISIDCNSLDISPYYVFSSIDKVFFCDLDSHKLIPCCYLEKAAIADGEAPFIMLE